jgi:hypothetical protein
MYDKQKADRLISDEDRLFLTQKYKKKSTPLFLFGNGMKHLFDMLDMNRAK